MIGDYLQGKAGDTFKCFAGLSCRLYC